MKKYSAHTELYIHIIWGTWDRLPLITEAIERRLYAAIAAKCRELTCIPLAIGGIEDHVHLLARLHAPISVSELVKGVKGSSSHLVTHEITPGQFFKWQGSYSAFSVSPADLPRLEVYIANQKQHHAANDLTLEWETLNPEAEE
ncbi:MAG: IS200/IS605 family transposase [Chloroflexi bacterium]|nr:IS200/IS605 family transposase [Chloroflexota bacterium]